MTAEAEFVDAPVVVIGAGQSGLATGYHLQQAGVEFTILADDERVGDTWRDRWDSLELFTPAFYNGLPGLDFPADNPEHLPHKDEMADYLETYAETFELPIELGTRVTRLANEDGRFVLETAAGDRTADQVVVATGAYPTPDVPAFADELPDDVFSCHSSEYRNPDQLQPGDALVVGAGNSGTQIATELATDADRQVWLAGRDTGRIPRRLLGRDIYRWMAPIVMRVTKTSFIGRRLYERMAHSGDPVFDVEHEKMQAAGVERVGRITAVENGRPVTDGGESFDVANVVWSTGFERDFSWVDLDVFDESGEPRHVRGVVEDAPGLYFVGLPWLYRPDSSLIGGVGRDAKYIAESVRDSAG